MISVFDSNNELHELLNDIDVLQLINIQLLRWLGHVVHMEENAPASRVFDAGICGSRRRGRPCIRWKDQIEEVLSSIGVTNWHRRARSRGEWKDVLRPKSVISYVNSHFGLRNSFLHYLWVLILSISGGSYSLKSTLNDRFFLLTHIRVFATQVLKGSFDRDVRLKVLTAAITLPSTST